jgi:hypothetical protein
MQAVVDDVQTLRCDDTLYLRLRDITRITEAMLPADVVEGGEWREVV